jgi:hypothetical protein
VSGGVRAKDVVNTQPAVIAGLDPAIPIIMARPCHVKRDGRVKPGHDESM